MVSTLQTKQTKKKQLHNNTKEPSFGAVAEVLLRVFLCLILGLRVPTTEVLRPDQRGTRTEPHLLVGILQAETRSRTSSGSAAALTSERALAQAEELTSHMKEKMTVTTKSWEKQKNRYMILGWVRAQLNWSKRQPRSR